MRNKNSILALRPVPHLQPFFSPFYLIARFQRCAGLYLHRQSEQLALAGGGAGGGGGARGARRGRRLGGRLSVRGRESKFP